MNTERATSRVSVQTDRPNKVAAAMREAIQQYRGDVDDPDVDISREDLDHFAEIVEHLEAMAR